MTARDIAREMALLAESPGDLEADHSLGDDLLVQALRLAVLEWPSFADIADSYESARRNWWYA